METSMNSAIHKRAPGDGGGAIDDSKRIWVPRLGVGLSLVVVLVVLWGFPPTKRNPLPIPNGAHRVEDQADQSATIQRADSDTPAFGHNTPLIPKFNSAPSPATTIANAPIFLKPAAALFSEQFASLHTAAAGADPVLVSPLEQWHQQFVHDSRDSSWSPMAQAQVASSLYAASLDSTLELVSVQCATSVCEIEVASTSPQAGDQAASDWQSTLSKMAGDSWWRGYGFGSQDYAQSVASDGRVLFVAYFNRAPEYTP